MPYKTYTPRGGSRTSRTPLPTPTPALEETPEAAQPLKEEKDVDMQENGQKKSFFARIKEGGVKKKVPKAVQKKRNNYRLRRLVAPKAPLTVLNELLGTQEPVTYTFQDAEGVAPNMPHMFTAMATVYGEKYQGMGPSKAIAKNICAEQVIQAIVAKKCAEKREMMDTGDENEKPKNEDETPWASLASLALFKLFNDWQAQGYVLPPDLNKAAPPIATNKLTEGIKKEEKRPAKTKEIPENPTSKHPVQLLNEMNGPIEFELTGETGDVPQAKVFTMSCTVQDKTYSGNGKSKKDAKKVAALAVLEDLYKITYPAAAAV